MSFEIFLNPYIWIEVVPKEYFENAFQITYKIVQNQF